MTHLTADADELAGNLAGSFSSEVVSQMLQLMIIWESTVCDARLTVVVDVMDLCPFL